MASPAPSSFNPFKLLYQAVSKGKKGTVQSLLKDSVVQAHINDKHSNGNTCLHIASSKGYTDIVRVLLSYGSDIRATNLAGQTPIALAHSEGNQTTAFVLQAHLDFWDLLSCLLDSSDQLSPSEKDSMALLVARYFALTEHTTVYSGIWSFLKHILSESPKARDLVTSLLEKILKNKISLTISIASNWSLEDIKREEVEDWFKDFTNCPTAAVSSVSSGSLIVEGVIDILSGMRTVVDSSTEIKAKTKWGNVQRCSLDERVMYSMVLDFIESQPHSSLLYDSSPLQPLSTSLSITDPRTDASLELVQIGLTPETATSLLNSYSDEELEESVGSVDILRHYLLRNALYKLSPKDREFTKKLELCGFNSDAIAFILALDEESLELECFTDTLVQRALAILYLHEQPFNGSPTTGIPFHAYGDGSIVGLILQPSAQDLLDSSYFSDLLNSLKVLQFNNKPLLSSDLGLQTWYHGCGPVNALEFKNINNFTTRPYGPRYYQDFGHNNSLYFGNSFKAAVKRAKDKYRDDGSFYSAAVFIVQCKEEDLQNLQPNIELTDFSTPSWHEAIGASRLYNTSARVNLCDQLDLNKWILGPMLKNAQPFVDSNAPPAQSSYPDTTNFIQLALKSRAACDFMYEHVSCVLFFSFS